MGTVSAVVLLTACANVANLLLVRAVFSAVTSANGASGTMPAAALGAGWGYSNYRCAGTADGINIASGNAIVSENNQCNYSSSSRLLSPDLTGH